MTKKTYIDYFLEDMGDGLLLYARLFDDGRYITIYKRKRWTMDKVDKNYLDDLVFASGIDLDNVLVKDIEILTSVFISDLEVYFLENDKAMEQIREFKNIKGL